MSVKMNRLMTRPRLVIEIRPDGSSEMKVHGGLNMAVVTLVLSNQLNTLLPRMFQEMYKNAGLVGAHGQPVANEPPVMTNETEPKDEDETESVS
jgi:hypothetical protein